MPNSDTRTTTDMRGLTAGAVLVIVSGTAAFHALTFDADSRMFPLTVAALLAMTGAGLILNSLVSRGGGGAVMLVRSNRPAVFTAAIIAVWATLFAGGAGFVLPTFLMQVALLYLAGLRRPAYIAATAILVTAVAYLLFVVLLDIPMPPSLLPPVFQDF